MSGNRVEGGRLVFGQGLIDGAFAGVVGGQSETPVFETAVQVLQVLGSGMCTLVGLEPLIQRPSSQPEPFGGGGSELKQSGGPGGTASAGIERRLDFGNPDELGG